MSQSSFNESVDWSIGWKRGQTFGFFHRIKDITKVFEPFLLFLGSVSDKVLRDTVFGHHGELETLFILDASVLKGKETLVLVRALSNHLCDHQNVIKEKVVLIFDLLVGLDLCECALALENTVDVSQRDTFTSNNLLFDVDNVRHVV